MDNFLEHAWRNGAPPFDGYTIRAENLPLELLAPVLANLVRVFRQTCGDRHVWSFEDWHEHDGFVKPRRAVTWQSLTDFCSSSATLAARAPNDDAVSLAFYTDPRPVLLRVQIYETEVDGHPFGPTGSFDVTGAQVDLDPLAATLLDVPTHKFPARVFFDKRYAG